MASFGITYSIQMDKTRGTGGKMTTRDRALMLEEANEPHVMNTIARGYRHFMNFRVPKKSGALRESARVLANWNTSLVFWRPNGETAKYMHYQFVGEVYGPNKAKLIDGERQWRSPVKPKRPTGRMMGKRFTLNFKDGTSIEVKGYTTLRPLRTGPDWINKFKEDTGKYGEGAVNIQAGRYIYEAYCKKFGKRCYGGYQVYHRWRRY